MSLLAIAGSFYYRSSNVILAPIMWDPRGSAFSAAIVPINQGGGIFNSQTPTVAVWGNPFVVPSGSEHATLAKGLGVYLRAWTYGDVEFDMAGVSTDGGATYVATLAIYRSGGLFGLRVKRGVTVLADTGPGVLSLDPFSPGSRYFVEWKITHGTASNGSTEVWINEVQRASASGVTTATSGTAWNAFNAKSGQNASGSNWQWQFDDFYANSGAGSAPLNGLLGDVIVAILGTEADSSIQWTTAGGSGVHWKQAAPHFGDGLGVADAVEGHRDVYDTRVAPPLPGNGETDVPNEQYTAGKVVYAVVSQMRANCLEVPRKLKWGIRVSGTDDLQQVQLSTLWTDYYRIHTAAPDGSAWDTTKLDALQLVLETGANTP